VRPKWTYCSFPLLFFCCPSQCPTVILKLVLDLSLRLRITVENPTTLLPPSHSSVTRERQLLSEAMKPFFSLLFAGIVSPLPSLFDLRNSLGLWKEQYGREGFSYPVPRPCEVAPIEQAAGENPCSFSFSCSEDFPFYPSSYLQAGGRKVNKAAGDRSLLVGGRSRPIPPPSFFFPFPARLKQRAPSGRPFFFSLPLPRRSSMAERAFFSPTTREN